MRNGLIVLMLLLSASLAQAQVKLGVEVLRDENFKRLDGKRVGVVANPASVDDALTSTMDLFRDATNFKLIAFYGPEHGIFGNEYAGDKVEDRKEEKTGLPVYSLYGKTRRPSTQMLKDIDVLVFDLQDIGARSYTYISTMKNCIDVCNEHDIELMILDRPNPIGGDRIEGPMLEKGYESFVGLLPVPYVHGMTMGELAQLTRDQFFPEFKKLTIVKMEGWKRDMVWTDLNRPWVPSSPHIPTFDACLGYVATGILGELYIYSIGVGYTLPFTIVGSPDTDSLKLSESLPNLPGVRYRRAFFKPFYSTYQGEMCQGVQVHMDPKKATGLVTINFELASQLDPKTLFDRADAKAKAEAEKAAADKAKKDGTPAHDRGEI